MFIRAHVYTGDFPKQPAFHTLGRQVADPQLITVYDIRDISYTPYTIKKDDRLFEKHDRVFKKGDRVLKKRGHLSICHPERSEE